jgi:hypothetical protein
VQPGKDGGSTAAQRLEQHVRNWPILLQKSDVKDGLAVPTIF